MSCRDPRDAIFYAVLVTAVASQFPCQTASCPFGVPICDEDEGINFLQHSQKGVRTQNGGEKQPVGTVVQEHIMGTINDTYLLTEAFMKARTEQTAHNARVRTGKRQRLPDPMASIQEPVMTVPDQMFSTKMNTSELKPPSGSAIWNSSVHWDTMRARHIMGVISNLPGHQLEWSRVSYLSVTVLFLMTMVSYPVFLMALIMVFTILMSMCLKKRSNCAGPKPPTPGPVGLREDPLFIQAALTKEDLTPFSQRIYTVWVLFCSTIPCLMVFGIPIVLIILSRPYPQEVFAVLVLLTSAMVYHNGLYMAIFAGASLVRMKRFNPVDAMTLKPRRTHLQNGGTETTETAEADRLSAEQVQHWVIIPQYKEPMEVVKVTLDSIKRNQGARTNISICLAMEEREMGAADKVLKFKTEYGSHFKEIIASFHPAGLPNDPPGKASNNAWAFKELSVHLQKKHVQDTSNILLTVCDADSEFHENYFAGVTNHYVELNPNVRSLRIWQSPMLHVKNYHRQPIPIVMGTIFSAMKEMASLSDPNAVNFPYSTYSMSMNLARRVGGWDPDWIAEDWHMGIKCFLFTLGEAHVEPILFPTLSYTPEDSEWFSTIWARWTQMKRHALGFSDLSYYFMMLPLVFGHSVNELGKDKTVVSLRSFWAMTFQGLTLVIKIVNVHAIIGFLTTYGAFTAGLRFFMTILLSEDRHVIILFESLHGYTLALMVCSFLFMALVSLLFLATYHLVQTRIEGQAFSSPIIHMGYLIVSFTVFGPVFFFALGVAVWIAAIKTMVSHSFEYEVAAKPTLEQQKTI